MEPSIVAALAVRRQTPRASSRVSRASFDWVMRASVWGAPAERRAGRAAAFQALEVSAHFRSMLIALLFVLLQGLVDDAL